MSKSYIQYAYEAGTNVIVKVEHAKKGGDYVCPDCEEKLIVRDGDVRCKHFSHHKKSDCRGESVVHKIAKQVVANALLSSEKINVKRNCPHCNQEHSRAIDTTHVSDVSIEQSFWIEEKNHPYRVDVFCKIKDKEFGIELVHTHRNSLSKVREFSDRLNWVELDAEDVIDVPYIWSAVDWNYIDDNHDLCDECRCKKRSLDQLVSQTSLQQKYYSTEFDRDSSDKELLLRMEDCPTCSKKTLMAEVSLDVIGRKKPLKSDRKSVEQIESCLHCKEPFRKISTTCTRCKKHVSIINTKDGYCYTYSCISDWANRNFMDNCSRCNEPFHKSSLINGVCKKCQMSDLISRTTLQRKYYSTEFDWDTSSTEIWLNMVECPTCKKNTLTADVTKSFRHGKLLSDRNSLQTIERCLHCRNYINRISMICVGCGNHAPIISSKKGYCYECRMKYKANMQNKNKE